MKKLIVMAVVAGVAAFAQAASIKWQTGGSIKPDGETLAGDGTLAIYTFALADQGAYNSLSLDSIWSTYGAETTTALENNSTFNGSGDGIAGAMAMQTVGNSDKGKTFYSAIIVAYDSNLDGKVDMYAVNKAYAEVNSSGSVVAQPKNLGLTVFGSDPTTNVKWESVPEPTSGLLLLLGVAGLALRRRRA